MSIHAVRRHPTITASVPKELLERVERRAQEEDRSIAAMVRLALRAYLSDDVPRVHVEDLERR